MDLVLRLLGLVMFFDEDIEEGIFYMEVLLVV